MLNFVTVNGDPWKPRQGPATAPKPRKPEKTDFHKGWKVVGIPPGAEAVAQKEHAARQLHKKEPKPFDRVQWLMNATAKPVRVKPYEVKEAAQQCADMALKAGWLRVEVRELVHKSNTKKEQS